MNEKQTPIPYAPVTVPYSLLSAIYYVLSKHKPADAPKITEHLRSCLQTRTASYITDEKVVKLFTVCAVNAPDGVVTRLPATYKSDLESALLRGFRKAEEFYGIRGFKSNVVQPAQEPVAWMAEKAGNVIFTNLGQSADELRSMGWVITPLVIAKPAQEPDPCEADKCLNWPKSGCPSLYECVTVPTPKSNTN